MTQLLRACLLVALTIMLPACRSARKTETCAAAFPSETGLEKQTPSTFTMSCGPCGRVVQQKWALGIRRKCQSHSSGAWKDQGPYIWFYSNGKIFMIGHSRDGFGSGEVRTWYPSGARWEDSYELHGKRDGPYRAWFENGQLAEKGRFMLGEPTGRWRYWTRSGRPSSKSHLTTRGWKMPTKGP